MSSFDPSYEFVLILLLASGGGGVGGGAVEDSNKSGLDLRKPP